MNLLQHRLTNQRLTQPTQQSVQEVVRWLGAVQSQEFNDAKWSVAQRTVGLTHDAFVAAFNAGHVLRTHVLRPTWHFVAPDDIRWMLMLTAPRIKAFMRTNDRKLGLDETVYTRTNHLIEQALSSGIHLTRTELAEALAQAGFAFTGTHLAQVVVRAELAGICCSGVLRGKQHTYALLEQRVLPTKPLDRDEALAELTKRYFASHGPATDRDFSWWSGLTLTDVRRGIALMQPDLVSETTADSTYWYIPASLPDPVPSRALLLPNFDEYVVGYANRSLLLDATYSGPLRTPGGLLSEKTIVINGLVVGMWRVVKEKAGNPIRWQPLRTLTALEEGLVHEAIQWHASFYRIVS